MSEQITRSQLGFTRRFGENETHILTEEAVDFLSELVVRFTPLRNRLLTERVAVQRKIDDGTLPNFISETDSIKKHSGLFGVFRKI